MEHIWLDALPNAADDPCKSMAESNLDHPDESPYIQTQTFLNRYKDFSGDSGGGSRRHSSSRSSIIYLQRNS